MLYLTSLLVSIVVTIAVMPFACDLARRLQAVDRPNHRKIHDHIMPKCGGIAMAVGVAVPIMLWGQVGPLQNSVLIGTLIIVLFGIADDIKDLNPYKKFSGQFMAAVVAIFIGGVKINNLGDFLPPGVLLPDWLAIPLTLIVIVGVTNATNLSDGLDGLAGGISLLIFLTIGYLGFYVNDRFVVLVSIAMGGAILGFLRFNSHPAKLFMGDAGSQLLGFVAILLSIKLTQGHSQLSVILPLIIIGLPILDTLTVMTKRLAKGRSPFAADRNHFHHQLITLGLYHTEAVVTIYIAQSLLISFAIVCSQINDWILFSSYICFSLFVVGFFELAQKRGYRINRELFLNQTKLRLKPLKDRGQAIKFAFGIVKYGVPSLLLFNVLLSSPKGDRYLWIAGVLLLLLSVAGLLNKALLERIAKFGLYLLTPFVIYRCDQWLQLNAGTTFFVLYNGLYLVLLVGIFLTVKLTRRTNGFMSSTLDFLVIFVILLIPNLPSASVKGYHLGLVAVKTVILFYSYEVLIGEMRKKSISAPLSLIILIAFAKNLLMRL